MKKNIFLIGCMVLGLSACYKSALDPLTGIYPAPTVVEFNPSAGCVASKVDGKRYFELNLTDGSTNMVATLVGDAYYLTANSYTEAEEVLAKKGNFVLGKTTVNGTQVKSGTITVGQNGENYTLKAVLFLADGTPYKMTWAGQLHFDPDPEPVALTQVFTAQSNLANGVQSVTLSLGSADISSSFDAATWTTTWSGNGNYLAIDLYSVDGYLHEGTYTASAVGGTINPGEFGIGYDTEFWGMTMYNWGTCWWTVDNGATSAEKITSGTITVEQKGSKWIITWGDESTYPKWARFEGAIEALTNTGGGSSSYDGVELTQNFGITDYTGWGMKMVGIELGSEGVVATPGGWGNTYSGNGNYLKLEIYSADGKIAPGTYTASAEGGVIGEGEFGIGYDGSFGASGTTWYTVSGDESTYQYVTDGTVTVELDGDSYKITIESSVVNARFGFSDNGGNGGGGFDGVELTKFCGSSDYTGWGINLAGVELGTDGITVEAGAWGNTYGGDGNYLKLEFYSTDGSLAPGEYKPCAEGGVVGEGEFGIGYDGSFGASGTTWYTLSGGESSYEYITDGTLKVEKDGDVYTIVLESSLVNVKYVGKLSAE
ncbi:MAG: hypothetical protein IJ651_05230 [Bacteroidales bacterium]|nr:hypothetical protein [Bacteroidales bacterium]